MWSSALQLAQQMQGLQMSSTTSQLQAVPMYVEGSGATEAGMVAPQYLVSAPGPAPVQQGTTFLSAPTASINSSCVPTMEFSNTRQKFSAAKPQVC